MGEKFTKWTLKVYIGNVQKGQPIFADEEQGHINLVNMAKDLAKKNKDIPEYRIKITGITREWD